MGYLVVDLTVWLDVQSGLNQHGGAKPEDIACFCTTMYVLECWDELHVG